MLEQKRQYFRVEYPESYRPSLTTEVEQFSIQDVSEYGIRVKVNENSLLTLERSVLATIAFCDGNAFELTGQVVRINEGFAGFQLATPLPLSLIRSEHLYLIKNYIKLDS